MVQRKVKRMGWTVIDEKEWSFQLFVPFLEPIMEDGGCHPVLLET